MCLRHNIHGHHIVQKTVPWRYADETYKVLDEATQTFKPLREIKNASESWNRNERSAWYIGKTQEKLKKLEIELFGTVEELEPVALAAHAEAVAPA